MRCGQLVFVSCLSTQDLDRIGMNHTLQEESFSGKVVTSQHPPRNPQQLACLESHPRVSEGVCSAQPFPLQESIGVYASFLQQGAREERGRGLGGHSARQAERCSRSKPEQGLSVGW